MQVQVNLVNRNILAVGTQIDFYNCQKCVQINDKLGKEKYYYIWQIWN